ncbi:CRISPR-associated protein Cas4 [bacterium]|nr:MAG: CRISPR-associated protein Cas4 [bacterium]
MSAVVAGGLLLAAALWLWRLAAAEPIVARLPRARVRYDDTVPGRPLEAPLVSHRHRLAGRPDFLVEHRGRIIPVEAKPARRAAAPRPGDVLQLAAYCLLVEDVLGQRPPFGILRYADRSWDVAFDDAARAQVLAVLDAMDADAAAADVARSHDRPGRCARCGLRAACDQRLA